VTRTKLPVPGPWQAAVVAAMADLVDRTGKPAHAVAAARVEPARWLDHDGAVVQGLSIWLVTGGRTYKYRGDPGAGTALALDTAPGGSGA
jgi:hypothetical protein